MIILSWRWKNYVHCHTKEWEQDDKTSGKSASRRSAEAMVGMMNSVYEFLNFTTELGEDFANGALPSLDTEIWVLEGWKVLFRFFEKTMATNLMVEAGSALSREVKMSTLSEEVTRRLRNTSQDLESSQRMEILEKACVKMRTSGHSEEFIREAVEKGIRAYNEKVDRSKLDHDHPSYQPLYQKAGWRQNEKSKEKAMKRSNWYKGDGKDKLNRVKDGKVRKSFQKVGKKKNKLGLSCAKLRSCWDELD